MQSHRSGQSAPPELNIPALSDVLKKAEAELAEALAAKERAEAERDALEKQCDGLRSALFDADADYARLTAALAGAREALEPFARQDVEHMISPDELDLEREHFFAARKALAAIPTTEPAKAEEP